MAYENIRPSGRDTGAPLNLQKRLALIQSAAQINGKKVIDCGCGSGQYLRACIELGADVYGIEYESEKVLGFKRDYPELADRVNIGDIETMKYAPASFDLALLNEVLEHVANEIKALQECYRVLKDGGILIIFSPNRLYPFETHSILLKGSNRKIPFYIPFIPYVPLPLGKRVFDYIARNYWPHQLKQLVRSCGFSIIKTDFVWQTFENISGGQPKFVTMLKPFLRTIFSLLERMSGIKAFGVSQMIIAQK